MYNKQHLKIEGLHKVISLKGAMNNGLTTILIKHFPNSGGKTFNRIAELRPLLASRIC